RNRRTPIAITDLEDRARDAGNRRLATNNYGNSNSDSPRNGRPRQRRHLPAVLLTLVARDCALLPATRTRGRRHRVAVAFLDRDRLGLRQFFSIQRSRRPALS